MKKFNLIILASFYLITGSIAQAAENLSVPSDRTYEPTDPERVLVLFDNPMEEHTVISVVIARGYNIKNEKALNKAIGVLKKESAQLGAHAVIILPPDHNMDTEPDIKSDITSAIEQDADNKKISGKAIRYKHFYY